MKSLIFVILCLTNIASRLPAYCQVDSLLGPSGSRFSIAGSVGFNNAYQRDNYLSPFVFDGLYFGSKLSFVAQTDMGRHTIDAFYGQGALNSKIQPRNVMQHVGYFSYSFVFSVATPEIAGNVLRSSVGGGISSFVMQTDFNTTDETNYTTYDQSWYWAHSVNLVLSEGYEIETRKTLSLRFTVPIALLVSRPANERWMNSNNAAVINNFFKAAGQGRMDYVWNNLAIFTDIEFRYPLGGAFDILAIYSFGYVSSGRPDPILSLGMYINTYMLGVLVSL